MNKNWIRAAVCVALAVTSLAANAEPIADSGITTDDVVAMMPARDKGFVVLSNVPCKDQKLMVTVGQPSYIAVSKGWLNVKKIVKGCYAFSPPRPGSDPNGAIDVLWETYDLDSTIKDSNLEWSSRGKQLALADRMRLGLLLDPTGTNAAAGMYSKAK